MKKLFLLLFLIYFVNCKEEKKEGKFTPPKDGIIRKEMADRYINVAVAFDRIVKEQGERINDFKKKYKLSDNLDEIYKAEFRQKHPEIIKEWEEINGNWNAIEDSIYKAFNTSEEEFQWVASALIAPKNKPMQEYIQKRISELTQSKETRLEEQK
uniref:Uncharacterized protein n=1 Tax=candidate division WOR-3 bacterium TaxID=2052148 RepID=A0A7C4Y537_UNCW3